VRGKRVVVEKEDHVCTLTGHLGAVFSVAFSPDGRYLASSSDDSTIKLWEIIRGESGMVKERCVATLSGHTNNVWSVAFSGDGRHLASGSSDETVKLWAITRGGNGGEGNGAGGIVCVATLSGHATRTSYVMSVAFSGDGRYLASGNDDKTIKLWTLTVGGRGGAVAVAEATCIGRTQTT